MAAVSLSVSTVKPLGDRIFIKVSESEEKTAGGILLPDTAKEKPQVGEVVQVGPGKRNDDGTRQAPEVSIGDKVLYSKYAGTDIKLGICGEHGGDPASISFCEKTGLDYVSCSPFRVPIARLAAAQAALGKQAASQA